MHSHQSIHPKICTYFWFEIRKELVIRFKAYDVCMRAVQNNALRHRHAYASSPVLVCIHVSGHQFSFYTHTWNGHVTQDA